MHQLMIMKFKFAWSYVFNAILFLYIIYYIFFYKTLNFTTSVAALCLIISFTYSPIAIYLMFRKVTPGRKNSVKKYLIPSLVVIMTNTFLALAGFTKILYCSILATAVLFFFYMIVFKLDKK